MRRVPGGMAGWALLWALPWPGLAQGLQVPQQEARLVPYRVEGDGIPQPLATAAGDAARGRAIVANRQVGLCLLCHAGPLPEERFQGNLAPDLAGSGTRWSEAQLRLRIVDAGRINPDTIMPAYYRIDGLNNVAPAVRGKPILDAQQVEDVVAYLRTLKEKEGN
ncbi:sulfur oxidation c-type cytochrome SoxX [Noviherbaspirillum sp. L7-7A]|uniref:sulfur oxidation c-type cytochrome SoxX n=1 Tax=Noviherbaspirillum sp. L7-7A TaxID=2850560 RepID=UPI001C2C3473|nr:sulfur oxidation c-type cytochrome SoxX [Noviherbaspirillum sp. L7-7A]MBV0881787.1 sulfur oxidation c-type cytochrome SoxX [Noviherbaspirillum sp. L7-7A]